MWLPAHGCKATIQIYRYFSKNWSSQYLNDMKICHFFERYYTNFSLKKKKKKLPGLTGQENMLFKHL